MDSLPLSGPLTPPTQPHDAKLMKAAQKLEASFLAEMLKSAGYGEAREALGGGAGEEQFASFLVDAQAEKMVQAGGIGLAEHLYQSLKDRQNEG
ncbi:rod-binding protein [uncultured Tateyamaria sp.]|uniref:rod-binding protein n=1 Tax=Tateyamaria sp. 1078 TaxID=3417464 RepID=UPI002633C258|nr:rod-binding protein [uncultured Tateyamaria sp.]